MCGNVRSLLYRQLHKSIFACPSRSRHLGLLSTLPHSCPDRYKTHSPARWLSTTAVVTAKKPLPSPIDEGYVPIYRFNHIVGVRALCRLKIYQTVLAVLCGPLYVASVPNALQTTELYYVLGVGAFAAVMLAVMGEIFRKFVGFVYYHPTSETVRISHLTFWGNRSEVQYQLDDIVSLTDIEHNIYELYLNLRAYSDPKAVYWISLKFGDILHEDHFIKVFGNLLFKQSRR